MSTRNYELTYIVKPTVDATNMLALTEKIKDIIAADGGSIVKTDVWGLRKLGYPINKIKEGQYVHLLVAVPPQGLKRIEQRLSLLEDIMRHLMVAEEILPQPRMPAAPAEAAVAPTA